jgi:hypothetical protein
MSEDGWLKSSDLIRIFKIGGNSVPLYRGTFINLGSFKKIKMLYEDFHIL